MKILLTIFLLSFTLYSSELYINEVMIDNDGTIFDFSGEDSDWLEIYNPNKVSINLFDYSLSDKVSDPIKWTFPEVIIPPKGFLIVFCSGKDTVVNGEIHTNFSLSENEVVSLYDNNPIVINRKRLDRLEIPDLVENQSFGHLPDGGNYLGKLSKSSPGLTNNFSDEIFCSVESGFYTEDKKVHLRSAMGFEIRYTLDGSEPTEESELYSKPIELSNSNLKENKYCNIPTTPNSELINYQEWIKPAKNIAKMHTLKYASFISNINISNVNTKLYYIDSLPFNNSLDIVSIVADSNSLFDAKIGIYVPGEMFDSTNPGWTGNYFHQGRILETPADFTYFNIKSNGITNQKINIKIHGGGTRVAAQKSLRLIARNYNGPDEFNLSLLNYDLIKFKSLNLKTTMGSYSSSFFLQNELISSLSKDLLFEKLHYKPVVVFLNGEYWGIHTLTENLSKDYLKNFHSLDKDSIDIVIHDFLNADFGSVDQYKNMIDFIAINPLYIPENYNYIKSKIDIESFIEYYIVQTYFANLDWPLGNIRAWKPKGNNTKWRWILYDLDASCIFDNLNYNMFEHITQDQHSNWPNSKESTFLFRSLIKNENFRQSFSDRAFYIVNNIFNIENSFKVYEEINSMYTPEMQRHYDRWTFPINFGSDWIEYSNQTIYEFLERRPEIYLRHLTELFKTTSVEISQDDFNVYPNPSNGFINIESEDVNYNCNVKIFNTFGELVYQRTNLNFSKLNIDLSYLPNGAYFIQIENNNNQLITKKINIIK